MLWALFFVEVTPDTTEDEFLPDAGDDLPTYLEHGLHWVHDWALRDRRVIPPNGHVAFWQFRANGREWEAQGWDESRRRWWIQEVGVLHETDTVEPVES